MIGVGLIHLAVLAHTATHGEAEEDCEAPSSAETSAEQQSESLLPPCTDCLFHFWSALLHRGPAARNQFIEVYCSLRSDLIRYFCFNMLCGIHLLTSV